MNKLFSASCRASLHYLSLVFICSLCITLAYAQREVDIAQNYLYKNINKHNLSTSALNGMKVSSAYRSPTTGFYHVYFKQTYQSIEVYNALLNVVVKDDNVGYVSHTFLPNIGSQVNFNTPVISPLQAIGKVADELKISLGQPKEIKNTPLPNGSIQQATFLNDNISDEDIEIKMCWLPYRQEEFGRMREKVVLIWNVRFLTKDSKHAWNVHVNAQSGEILQKKDEVLTCNFGTPHHINAPHICEVNHDKTLLKTPLSTRVDGVTNAAYNVFDYPVESPSFGTRSLVTNPFTKFTPTGTGPGVTNGWHNDGMVDYTTTRGNNVWTQEDNNGNDSVGVSPISANLVFDFPYTQALASASANQNAAITNLFYWNNLMHDVLWKYGFDEPSGNFQNSNLDRGGAGNDYVFADAQDGGGINNANFLTPPDGKNGRMQMFLFNTSNQYQPDGGFDNGVISHEYAHGWSTRLTGGPANSQCLANLEQGGEGWSDFASLMFTTDWASLTATITSANIAKGIGTYVMGQPTTGQGIRPYRYSYDMVNVNGAVTYGKVSDEINFSFPHGTGSIWATMLWDMTWEIIMQDNHITANIYDIPANVADMKGNIAALKLVNEGLRLQPCSPSFVDARDAIFAADRLLFGGRYRCAIGRAFARRGLGYYASTGASSDDRIVIEDFTPFPSAPLTSPQNNPSICSNTTFSYTATASSNTPINFSWTRPAQTGISNPSASGNSAVINETLINTTAFPITVQYFITVSPDPCGMAVPQKISVVVNPGLSTPIVGAFSVCQNETIPSGKGLEMPPALGVYAAGELTESSPKFHKGSGDKQTTYTPAEDFANNVFYKSFSFVAPSSGEITFETVNGNLTGGYPFDTYIALYQNTFNPSNPATNFVAGDDDSGTLQFASKLSHSLVKGTTYILVVSGYFNESTGQFLIQSSAPVFPEGGFNLWYTQATGGDFIAYGDEFNPVGVAGSGIINTATPGTTTFYVATDFIRECRIPVTFTVKAISGGSVAGSTTVCSGTNSTQLTLTGQVGNIIKWQSSLREDFSNPIDIQNINPTLTVSNLNQTTYYRAVINSEGCTQYSSVATITVSPGSVAGHLSGNALVCSGINSTLLTLTGNSDNVQKWQSSLTADFANATDIDNKTTTLMATNLNTSTYYRVVIRSNICNFVNSNTVLVRINTKPIVSLSANSQVLHEGKIQTFCNLDPNATLTLVPAVSTSCIAGSVLWRIQIGTGDWSDWSTTAPSAQPNNNTSYRYQAACDGACSSTFTNPITININYRPSAPQNVALTADGTTLTAGQAASICDLAGNTLQFTATCASGEIVTYSVDGTPFTTTPPNQIIDGLFHNYRVRCNKSDGSIACFASESAPMTLRISPIPLTPRIQISPTNGCGVPAFFLGSSNCGTFTTVWYDATTQQALAAFPNITPLTTQSYYARCQNTLGCLGEPSNTVTFSITPVSDVPVITASAEVVCMGMEVTLSTNCPTGANVVWNETITQPNLRVSFSNVTRQNYTARCVFGGGCQSPISSPKTIIWKAFDLTFINIGTSKSGTKTGPNAPKSAWSEQFITADGGPTLEKSTETTPTLFFAGNLNKTAPRYWTIHADACALGTDGSLTFDMLASPENGAVRSFNTHENNAPYLMYANRDGFTELYAQNHPAYGFFLDNGNGIDTNVYDEGLPKGLYKLGIRYWSQKGQGSIYPSTRQPQGTVLAYQEYWFRIQSKNGVGTGAARESTLGSLQLTVKGQFAHVIPNPVVNTLRLLVNDAKAQKVNVSLLNASGQTLLQRGFVPQTNAHQEEFDVSQMAYGMYFLRVNTDDKQATLKVVKVQ
jgi:hypothetical protein